MIDDHQFIVILEHFLCIHSNGMVSSIAMANIMNQYNKCRGGSLTNRWMAGHNVEVSSQLIILGIRQIKLS